MSNLQLIDNIELVQEQSQFNTIKSILDYENKQDMMYCINKNEVFVEYEKYETKYQWVGYSSDNVSIALDAINALNANLTEKGFSDNLVEMDNAKHNGSVRRMIASNGYTTKQNTIKRILSKTTNGKNPYIKTIFGKSERDNELVVQIEFKVPSIQMTHPMMDKYIALEDKAAHGDDSDKAEFEKFKREACLVENGIYVYKYIILHIKTFDQPPLNPSKIDKSQYTSKEIARIAGVYKKYIDFRDINEYNTPENRGKIKSKTEIKSNFINGVTIGRAYHLILDVQ